MCPNAHTWLLFALLLTLAVLSLVLLVCNSRNIFCAKNTIAYALSNPEQQPNPGGGREIPKDKKKIISFSLFGKKNLYNLGAYENAVLAPSVYPGWICRFYVAKDANQEVVEILREMPHVEIVVMPSTTNLSGMMWRFIPIFMESHAVVVIRDSDSRLNIREKAAVDEWLQTPLPVHFMRDHPNHQYKIMGGMWGARGDVLNKYKEQFSSWKHNGKWGDDQTFLQKTVYSFCINKALSHTISEAWQGKEKTKPFPKTKYKGFVGAVIDAYPYWQRRTNH